MMRAMMLPAEPTEDGGVGIVMHFAGYKVRFLSFTSSAAGVGYIITCDAKRWQGHLAEETRPTSGVKLHKTQHIMMIS